MASITKIGLGVDPRNNSGCIGSSDGGTLYCPSAAGSGCFTQAQKIQLIRMKNVRSSMPKGAKKELPQVPSQGIGVL